MSLILDALDYVKTALTGVGLTVVDDPRNAQPPCVILDPPTVRVTSATIVETDVRATVLCPPPGNKEAMTRLLTDADLILETVEVVDGAPGAYTLGTMDLPAYSLTIRNTFIRTP